MAAAYRDEWPVLLVVPSGLRNHWVDELRQWLPGAEKHSMVLFCSRFILKTDDLPRQAWDRREKSSTKMRMLWLPESWLNVAAPPNPHRKKKRKKAGVKAIPPAVHLVVRKRPVLSDHFLISKRSFYQDRLGTTIDGKLKTGTHRLFLQENALELPATVSIRQTSRCFSRDNQKRSLAETGSGEISAGDLNQRGCVSAGWRACADLDSELRSAAQDSGIAPASDHHL